MTSQSKFDYTYIKKIKLNKGCTMTMAEKKAFLLKQNQPKSKNRAVKNELLEAIFSDSNAVGLKIIFYLAKQNLSIGSDEVLKFTLNTFDLRKHTNCSLKTIRRNIDLLMKTTIIFKDPHSDDVELFQLIPRSKYIYGEAKIEIDIFPKVFELISQVKKNFSIIDIDKLMELTNKNSIRTLMLLERINNYSKSIPKRKTYTLDELNALFGLDYKTLSAFTQNILQRAQDDLQNIDSKLNLQYQTHFEPQAIGRPKASTVTIDLIRTKYHNIQIS